MNISSWAIRNPVPVALLFILLTILGIFSFRALPVQGMPEAEMPVVFISAALEGAAPEQLETAVARKIEDRLASLSRLDYIQTTITNGLVSIVVVFEIEKNSEAALNEVRNAVESARNDLPADMTPPNVSKETTQPDILATYAVRSGKLDETELSWFVDNELTKTLLSVRGVGEVARLGGIDREIHVDLDPDAMTALGITATDVSAALGATQADFSGGRAEISANRQNVRALGAPRTLDDIAALHVPGPKSNIPVRLGEIAAITDTFADRTSLAHVDGLPVVAVQIKRAYGFSDIDVLNGVRAALDSLREKTPDVTIAEAATTIGPTIEDYDASMRMLWEGALIAIVVVFIFLKSWRATLIAATALPLSIIPAFIAMHASGFSLNVISLVALSLVIGVLVDDAIVEIENIARHSRLGKTPAEAAREATSEIGLAVVATTLTLVAVFLPTAFMGGIPGLVFRQFGITAAAAVLASLLVARLLTPVMAAKWMKPASAGGEEKDGRLMRAYLALVRKALAHRKTTAAAVALFLAVSLSLAALLNGAMVPPQDRAQTSVLLTLPPGSSLRQTEKIAAEAAARIARIPEVKTTFAAIGTAASGDGPDASVFADCASATLTVTLTPLDTRKRKQSEIENDIRDALATLPGVRVEVGVSGEGAKLDITLAGDDPAQLETTAALLETQLRTLKGTGAVISTAALEAPEIQVTPDFARAAALGVTTQAIADTARVATSGDYAARLAKLNLPERQIPIRVGFAPGVRADIDALSQLRVPAADGATVALGDVARVALGSGPAMLTRLDRSRNITVSVELNGRSLGEVLNEAMELPVLKNLPEGVFIAEQGEAQRMLEMFESFGIAMLVGLFCVYGVLVLLFHDFLQPVTILMAIPLALGGALLPLVVTGNSFSMAAAIGLLTLMGIVTKNSILLVEYIIMSREKGMARLAAILDACHKRARPIIMTTLAMTGGMLPVILGLAGGDPSFRFPMAIVVAGGLMTSTLLSLVVIPVTYTLVDDVFAFFKRLVLRGKITALASA
ncbi:efflux RND transporter permease subunit [Ereboglobus luteus]|uniref:RND transporter n=1 Tax=Ereboglobus luteus TaxID=1796921 RepID=A0A2U8E4P8_9BACT|nr:efflux RND transporter permease subunit [Ereboglobus luteus]AWI09918.1 RND transporter [Ereboglobus luteus]